MLCIQVLLHTVVALTPMQSPATADGNRSPQPEPSFVQNAGQWDARARFKAKLPGVDVWNVDDGILLDYYRYDLPPGKITPEALSKATRTGNVVKISLVGAGRGRSVGVRPQGTVYNFLGKHGATRVPAYSESWLKGAVVGVDVRYYTDRSCPRYDLVVRPGTDPARARLRYEGVANLRVGSDGALRFDTSLGTIEERGLKAYQRVGNETKPVAAKPFIASDGVVGYRIGNYDRTRPLVIDPMFRSFVEFHSYNFTEAIAARNGLRYVTGFSADGYFTATPGAYQSVYPGGVCAFVSCQSGYSISWWTYFGDASSGSTIALDSLDRPVIGGTTYENLPATAGAYDETYNGFQDGFVARLSADGTALDWATFIGGPKDDEVVDLCVDAADRVVVAGNSPNLPTTASAYDRTANGLKDGFVLRLAADGSNVDYATLFGGGKDETVANLMLDGSARPIVVGRTRSVTFPTTAGAGDRILGGEEDGFVTVFNASGSGLVASSYLGGGGADRVKGVTLAPDGDLYVTGETSSTDFPITPGSFAATFNGGASDAFVARLNASNLAVDRSTLYGGAGADRGAAVILDGYNRPVLFGDTQSPNLPLTDRAFNDFGGQHAFCAVFSEDLSTLYYGTFITNPGFVVVVNDVVSATLPVVVGCFDILGGTVGVIGSNSLDYTVAPYLWVVTLPPSGLVGNTGRPEMLGLGYDLAVPADRTITFTGVSEPCDLPPPATVPPGQRDITIPIPTHETFEDANPYVTFDDGYWPPYTVFLTVLAPTVTSVKMARQTVVAGKQAYATLQFPNPLPPDGQIVPVKLVDPSTKLEIDPSVATLLKMPEGAPYGLFATCVINTGSSNDARQVAVLAPGGVLSDTLTINRTEVDKVTFTVNPLNGGLSTMGYAVLSGNAPSGGMNVLLSSDNPYAIVPATCFVPEGVKKQGFNVTTATPLLDTVAHIYAGRDPDGTVVDRALTVLGPKPASVTVTNEGAQPGTSTTFRVTMSIKAPAGGIVVPLIKSGTKITIPLTATIPAGSKQSKLLTVKVAGTATVGASYTITATYNNASASGTVKVLP